MAKIKDLKLEEAQELLTFLGIEDSENFKENFSQKFFTKETALASDEIKKAIVGKRMTEIEGSLLKLGKIVDPELTRSKLGEKQIEENIEGFMELFSNKFTELETKASTGNDKKVNDLERMLQDKDKSLLSYKELAEKEAAEKERVVSEYQNGMKSYKINHQFEQYKNKLSWIDEPTDVQRIGFDTKISTSYKFDLDEKDNLVILSADGKPIPSKVKGGAMADPLEILDFELDQNKLKKNNNAKVNSSIFVQPVRQEQSNGKKLPAEYLKRIGGK